MCPVFGATIGRLDPLACCDWSSLAGGVAGRHGGDNKPPKGNGE